MNHFRERIRRLRTGLMAFLLMLGSMFGVLTPAMQAYAAEPTITGTCHIEVDDLGANTGGSEPYTTFFVTMPDGQTYHGECIDHGSYIPLAGNYPFTGTWNGTSYDIIVESRYFADTREDVCPEERPNFDLYGQGYTQRVGNFTYMPYGYVRIVKESADPALTDGNAMYSLAGAEFTVTSQDGSVLGTLTTGEDGTTGTLEVPAGQTVTIRETKPPEGFLPAAEQAVAITTQETATVTFTDAPAHAWVVATDANGFAFLDEAHLMSGDDLYRDASGQAVIPRGTLVMYESKPSEGYVLNSDFLSFQKIQEQPVENTVTYQTPQVPEQVVRGDLTFSKKTGDSADRMAGIPFKLTSLTTGETHVIVTDANGYFNSASSWNHHTQNTNGNDWALGESEPIDSVLLDPTAGVWFGLTSEGTLTSPDDGHGAFPYDSYSIEELRCTANEGYQLIHTTVTITRDGVVYDYGTLDDQPQPTVSITTNAYDPTDGDNSIMAGDVRIADKVTYTGLTAGETYRLTASIVDTETGEPVTVDDKPVTATHEFTAQTADGYEIVETTLPTTGLGGRTVTVFEELHRVSDGTLMAEHKDKDDVDQQLRVIAPQIGTTATDGTDGDKTVIADEKVIIVDTVEYRNLVPGVEYALTGTLHVKHVDEEGNVTEEALLDGNGEPIIAETTFTPDSPDGSMEVRFTFDATTLPDGTELVAFETLFHNGEVIAVHADITDKGQTVTVEHPEEPEIPDTPEQPALEHPTPEPDKPQGTTYGKTGVSTMPIVAGIVLLIAAAGGTAFCAHRLHRKDGSDGHDE